MAGSLQSGGNATPDGRGAERRGVLCTCVDFTYEQLETMLRERADADFDSIMAETGAGHKCTACRLDLEFAYSSSAARPGAARGRASYRKGSDAIRLKQRIYGLIDRLTPPTPIVLRHVAPIVAGGGFSEYIAVANDRLLYEADRVVVPVTCSVSVHDADGNRVFAREFEVTPAAPLNLDVSALLPAARPGEIVTGHVKLDQRWRRSSFRGTARPQIVIEGSGGVGSVHMSAHTPAGETSFANLFEPSDDRLFISCINPSRRPLPIEIAYPLWCEDIPSEDQIRYRRTIPPEGSDLHEVIIPAGLWERLRGRTYGISCAAAGPQKFHAVNASASLDRLSIDHPSGL